MKWPALVVRQTRPKQWLVAAESPPPRDTILTEHGCILALPTQAPLEKSKGKGKGKGKKGKGPTWLLGSHPGMQNQDSPPGLTPTVPQSVTPVDIHGPIKKSALQMEQMMEQRLAAMREEASASNALFRQDLNNMKQEMATHVMEQRQEVKTLTERVANVETNLSGQLTAFMSSLNATIAQQGAELTGKLAAGQESLRNELTSELRQHMGSRKRTPPPAMDKDGDKRMKEQES